MTAFLLQMIATDDIIAKAEAEVCNFIEPVPMTTDR